MRPLSDVLADEVGDVNTKPGPKKANGTNYAGDSMFDAVNLTPIESVLDWLGIEHDEKRVKCPHCGNGFPCDTSCAIVGNAVKCSHDTCSGAGPNGFAGLRTGVDLTMLVHGVEKIEAVKMMAARFGIDLPRNKAASNDTEGAQQPLWEGGPAEEHARQQAKPRFAFEPLGDLNVAPASIPWFMTVWRDGHKHFIWPRGEIFALVAHGGTGKGYASLELAVCTALALPWFGVFNIEHPGHVAVMTGEDSFAEVKRRIWKICNQFVLNREQRNKVSECVHVLPLLGLSASLVEQDPLTRSVRRTEFYAELVRCMITEAPKDGFAAVIIDPLSRLAGEAETSNHLATQFVSAIEEMVTKLPGNPSMLPCHHANMSSARQGKAESRGVSGLHDGWRGEFTLTATRTESGLEGVQFSCTKNNHGYRFRPMWLVRCVDELDAKDHVISEQVGVLRPASDAESEELNATKNEGKFASPVERKEAKRVGNSKEFLADCELVCSLLPESPAFIMDAALNAACRANGKTWDNKSLKLRTTHLVEQSRAVDLSVSPDGTKSGKCRQWARPAVTQVSTEPESDPQGVLPL
jgi:hypothetical protein